MSATACEHGVPFEELCEPCAHQPYEEWVGYPMTACQFCHQPWPCDYTVTREDEQ